MPELNGLRAIAILLVFAHHVRPLLPGVNRPMAIGESFLELGWCGVDLFFVLSGFLITGILLDTKDAGNYFRGFYARRALRIFPLYYAVLTLILVGGGALHNDEITAIMPLAGDRWLYFTYLTNWLVLWKGTWGPNCLGHFWSLAVEEQFYFVWPLLVWLMPRRAVLKAAVALSGLAVVTRIVWIAHTGPHQAIAIATVTRMDALFIGAICASVFRDAALMGRLRKWLPWIAAGCLGAMLCAFTGAIFHTLNRSPLGDATLTIDAYGGYTVLAAGFGALILIVADHDGRCGWLRRVLRWRPLNPVGTYSYGIYVFHVPILMAANIYIGDNYLPEGAVAPALLYIAAIAAVTFAVAATSYELFEKKILGFKRHFEARYSEKPGGDTAVAEREPLGP